MELPKQIDFINERLEHWQNQEIAARRALEYAQRQISILIGHKTLRLVGETELPFDDYDEDSIA